jgi:LmbE family N-acetylglucosaminyl deacetylase
MKAQRGSVGGPGLRGGMLVLAITGLALLIGVLDCSTKAQTSQNAATVPLTWSAPLPLDRGSVGLWQSLKKLHTRASLLQVTAHPDDEDGGMLAYQARGQGTRTMLLCLTRGEGGANVMSQDYFDALGLVRTEELLMAGRYYGVEQYWGHVIDYGFSKTKDETLKNWTHDRVLADAVRVVRMTRPLVVTSVFIGGPTDGHGNHQTTGQMMQEVFVAAGDSNAFPEQIKEGLRPWSPVKTYGRTPMRDLKDGAYSYIEKKKIPSPLPVNVTSPNGTYDPVLGSSYSQIAREGLGYQKCQNGGTGFAPAGEMMSPYTRFGSTIQAGEKENSFFDGIDVSLAGIATLAKSNEDAAFLKQGLAEINTAVEQAIKDFSIDKPEKVAPSLAAGLKANLALIRRVEDGKLSADSKYNILHELGAKRQQFNEAICQALGLVMESTVTPETAPAGRFGMGVPETFQVAIPGQKFWVKVAVTNPTSVPVQLERVFLASSPERWMFSTTDTSAGPLAGNKPISVRFAVNVPSSVAFTRPYFTRTNIDQGYYDMVDKKYMNLSHMPYSLAAWANFTYEGVQVQTAQVVQAVDRITGSGTVLQPLVVAPAISVGISPGAGVVPLDAKSFSVTTTIRSNVKGPAKGNLRLELPAGWTSAPQSAAFTMAKDDEEQSLVFQVTPRGVEQKAYQVTAVADCNGHQYREGYHMVGYPGLRNYPIYRASTFNTTGIDLKLAAGLTVGYVMGSGDEVPKALENLAVKVEELTSQDLATSDLGRYNVILLGVRTYAVRDDLRTYNSRLIEYVKNGGGVIVQYNTPEFDNNYGPYPYSMTGNPEEVTEQDSQVQILNPNHALFNWPNKITAKDFEGWVEERGSKFMKTWDPQYEALLETHDLNQEPQKGGLLYSKYGNGIYVYCAYAFYRQLPEGVPGAYRLFANLVSLSANPQARSPQKPPM